MLSDMIGKKCRIVINEGKAVSIYTAKILIVKDGFVEIEDKFGSIISLNIDSIVKVEEVKQ